MKKPLRASRLSFKTIGLETIILDTKVGQEVHQLNEVGTFVWSLCDGNHGFENICSKVIEEFEIDSQTALKDIQDLMIELDAKQLLSENQE